jgi:hypothetical protein
VLRKPSLCTMHWCMLCVVYNHQALASVGRRLVSLSQHCAELPGLVVAILLQCPVIQANQATLATSPTTVCCLPSPASWCASLHHEFTTHIEVSSGPSIICGKGVC